MEPPYVCECMSLWIYSWAWHVMYIYHCMCKYYEHMFVVGNYIPCATPCLSLSWFVHAAGMCTGPGTMHVNGDACVLCWLAPMTWQCVRCWCAIVALPYSYATKDPLDQQFSTWGLQPLWGLNDPFTGVTLNHWKTQIFPLKFITVAANYRYEVAKEIIL